MPTLESVDPSILYCMFKGEPGTRKSTAALSFPKPQYWFSWDRKMEGILIPARNWGVNPKEIQYDDYEDWTKARIKLEQLQTNCPFKTLIIDSVTSCADTSLRQVLKQKSGDSKGKKIAGIEVNSIEDYNAESSTLTELMALTKDIHKFFKVNVILIAHVVQADYKNAQNETHVSRTIVTAAKKIAAKMPAYCGEVYHFNIKKGIDTASVGDYTAITQHTGDDFARTALPLPKEIKFNADPLYDKWIKPAIEQMKGDLKLQTQTTTTVKV